MNIGFRIVTHVPKPSNELVDRFEEFRSCDISDVMNRAGTMVGIRAVYTPIPRIVGTAVTVSIPAGGINMIKLAIEHAGSGDVIVASVQGDTTYAMLGGNISLGMQARGIKGFVIDGAVRDVSEIRDLRFPTFAKGIATAAADLGGPRGEVNVPIACGGVVVNPGDIIVADEDGIVVVPPAAAIEVLAAVPKLIAHHEEAQVVLRRGGVTSIDRITDEFVSQGMVIESSAGRGDTR